MLSGTVGLSVVALAVCCPCIVFSESLNIIEAGSQNFGFGPLLAIAAKLSTTVADLLAGMA